MVKNLIVACRDNDVKKIVLGNACTLFGKNQVSVCNSYTDLYEKVKYAVNAAIIFDKFFLGYVISYSYSMLTYLNTQLLAYFVEMGECSPYLAMRLLELGASGFIPHVEHKDIFKLSIQKIQAGLRTYPEYITQRYNDDDYERRCMTEVTAIEMKIGMYLAEGKQQKEIASITGLSKQAVSSHIHRLKRKIGYSRPSDLDLLSIRHKTNELEEFVDY